MRRQFGSLLIAALFGAAGTAAILHPATNPATTTITRPGTAVPTLPRIPPAFDPPASVHEDPSSRGPAEQLVARTATSGSAELPPARALEAYQRATTVMGRADPTCQLSWPLLAAIGSIESDHGRVGGTVLAPDGVAHPEILGPPLDGADSTARIVDTDQGSLDGDVAVDRALGPLQLIPSTWAVVAVDGDGDGIRDPQDIDDASLAAAVYLCAWHDDLATDAGRRAAVFRYNRSWSYVGAVLQTMQQYATAMASDLVTVLVATVSPPPGDEVATAAEPPGAPDTDPIWTLPLDAVWGVPPTTEWVAGPTTAPPDPVPTTVPTLAPSPTTAATPAPTPTPTTSPSLPPPEETPEPSTSSEPDPTRATEAATEAATTPSSTAPSKAPGPQKTHDSPDPSPTSTALPPAQSDPTPSSAVGHPAGLSPAEAEAWSSCVSTIGSAADDTKLAECVASALGLPLDDPRLVWLLAQVPGREDE